MSQLIEASVKRYFYKIENLLQEGIDPNIQDEEGRTALMICAFFEDIDSVRILLEHGADPNIKTSRKIIRKKPTLETSWQTYKWDETEYTDPFQQSALHICASHGSIEIINLLLKHGAQVNAMTQFCQTPLYIACKKGFDKVIKILLDNDADMDVKCVRHITPFYWASYKCSTSFVRDFIKNVKNIDQQCIDGKTALFNICEKGLTEKIKLLLENGADPNIPNKNGLTAIELLCQKERTTGISILLMYGAKPPTTISLKNMKPEIREIFAEYYQPKLREVLEKFNVPGDVIQHVIEHI